MLDSLTENSQLAYLKTEVSNTQDMSDLASMSQLKGLYITNAPLRASLDELAAFNHLEELAFVSSGNSNLDWLASLTNIKALTINLADEVTDFSVLYGMPNLEKLAIDKAEFLKELDFVKNMPNLNELAISRSSVQSISSLEGKMSLSALTLDDNKIMDLSPLKSLDNLTHLSVTGLPDNSQSNNNRFNNQRPFRRRFDDNQSVKQFNLINY